MGSGDGGGRACGGEPVGAAGSKGVVGQGPDVVIGQVGGLDPLGDAAFGDEQGFAGVDGADVGGGEPGAGPAVAQDDVGGAGGGAAAGGAVAEQVAQALGDDVDRWPLGGGDDGHGGGAAAGYQVAEQGEELALFLLGAEHGGEDGDLVEDGGDDGQAVGGFDLAAAVGAEPGVPVFHHLLQPQQGDDGAADVGADEFVGGLVPHAELDVFGVEQHQAAAGGEGGVGGHGVEQAGFAAAGFARGEQVHVDQADVEGLAEFVAAHVDGVVHGQHRPDRDRASCRCGAGHDGSPPRGGGEPQAGQGRGVGFLRVGGGCQPGRGEEAARWRDGPGGGLELDPVGDVAAVAGSRGGGWRRGGRRGVVWPLDRGGPDGGDFAGGDLGQVQRGREVGGVPLGGGGAGLDQVQQGGGDGAAQDVAALDVEPDERGVGRRGGLGQGGGGPAGDGDLVQPVEQVIQREAGAQPDPHAFPDRGGACPQDQRQAAGAVFDDEFGE